MPDPAELEMMQKLLAGQPRVPLSGVKDPNGQQAYAPPGVPEPPSGVPSWYRNMQPYPINPAAAFEGVMGAGIPAGGAVAPQLADALGRAAGSPLARALAGGVGLSIGGTPSTAGDSATVPAGQSTAPNQAELMGLLEQQKLLSQQTEAARQRREAERKTGQGNNYKAADAEFQSLNRRLDALNTLVDTAQKRGSPGALLDAKKAQDEFTRQSRERDMNTSVKEMLSDVMPYVPIGSAVLAAGTGGAIKGGYVGKFNTQINELSKRWEQAVTSGNKPLAQQLATEFQALEKAGPGGSWPAVMAGAGIGEMGQILPVASDYAKSLPGSDLYKKTTDTMKDPWEVGGRVVNGALLGGGPAEIASLLMGLRRSRPVGFGAETRAMPDPRALPPPLPPNTGPIQGGPLTPVPPGPLPGGGGQGPAQLTDQTGAGAKQISNRDLMEALGSPANVNETKKAVPIKGRDGKTRYHDPDSGDFAPKDLPRD